MQGYAQPRPHRTNVMHAAFARDFWNQETVRVQDVMACVFSCCQQMDLCIFPGFARMYQLNDGRLLMVHNTVSRAVLEVGSAVQMRGFPLQTQHFCIWIWSLYIV